MPGVKSLRKIYIGQEADTDQGTAVAATAQLRFEGVWQDDTEVAFPPEDSGYMGGRDRAYVARVAAAMAMAGPATFEQLPYILDASIAAATPTTDAGSGVQYSYDFPTTAQGTITTYTIEAGDDQQEEEAAYCHVTDFELSGESGGVWNLSANWMGRQVSTDSFTASSDITVTDVEEMLFQNSKLYIDASTDSFGTTEVSNTLLSATLRVDSGWMGKFAADGNLFFSFLARTGFEALLNVTFEHNASAVAEKAAWRNGTPRNLRILCEGSALGTTDTYGVKTLHIDLPGKWESFEALDESDGNDVVTGTFRSGRYSSDAASAGSILVVNELTSLP